MTEAVASVPPTDEQPPVVVPPTDDESSGVGDRAPRARVMAASGRRRTLARVASLGVFAIIFVPVYGLWLGDSFLKSQQRLFDIYQNTPVLIMSAGLVVCLVSGQFDLSVGSTATLAAFLTIGLRVNQGMPFWLVLVLIPVLGMAIGLINGLLVVKLRVNAFIATLATGGIVEGISNVYSGGEQLTQSPTGPRIPKWFTGIGSFGSFQNKTPQLVVWLVVAFLVACAAMVVLELRLPEERDNRFWTLLGGAGVVLVAVLVFGRSFAKQVPWEVVFLFGVATVLWVVMRYTAFGRSMYAIGGNPVAARLSGVPVDLYTVVGFMISATVAAIAGALLAANQGTAVPGIAIGYLLPAYAAVFLSTVILSDGRFHVWGSVVGGICVVYIAQGLIIGGIQFTWTQVINGVVLAVAVAFATLIRGKDASRAS